jgi:predicted nucleotidyltransferase
MLIQSAQWQEAAIEALVRLLQPDEAVRALALFGRAAQPNRDLWSDIDLLLVVDESATRRFHPALDWLKPLGELYTWDQSAGPWTSVTRACFTDFRRIDFIITTEAALEQIDQWPHVPFWKGSRVLSSRSPTADQVLARMFVAPLPPLISDEEFERMVNSFWFKGMLAVQKVMRDDRLIALHLALEMVQDCCVLGMLLRDRAEGTAHHRRGGSGNKVAARLEATRHPHTALGILDSLEQSSLAFDELARQWSGSYHERRGPLLEWISIARQRIGENS